MDHAPQARKRPQVNWSRPAAKRAWARTGLCVACLLLLAGCAQQRIRDQAETLLRGGEFERSVQAYEQGLKEHPDSVLLRSGLLQARSELMARLVAEAGAARAAGRLDEAEQVLRRAQALEPANARVAALLGELSTERYQQQVLAQAEALAGRGQHAAALKMVELALKDTPRHAGLLALQRRLEMEQRHAQARSAQAGLAERRPVSLDFRDASLRTVLDVVSRHSGINFVFDKDIRTDVRVTVYLQQAPLEDALDLITSTYQLSKKVIDERTILIYPNTPEKRREHQEQLVKVFYLASAEAKNAAAFLRSMLKSGEIFVDDRTNMLALRDAQEGIQLAERLIALYDARDPEVLLEVEVLEIRSTRLTELGVKFPDTFTLTPLDAKGSSSGGLTVTDARDLNAGRIQLTVGGVTVNLKREVGDFNILANPRIRARSKEKAKVLIGDRIPIITATVGTGGFVSDSVSYVDVGLKLDVEPTVYADDEVAIRVGLEVSSLGTQVKTTSGSLAYQIGTRNASTLLRLRDGETQLLAGLISREDRTSASRVPGLGDLPVLGRLFSSQRDDGARTELVLAVTPRILRGQATPPASETELWVGTEAAPRLRPMGGRLSATGPRAALPGPDAAAVPAGAEAGVPGAPGTAAALPSRPVLHWKAPAQVRVGEEFTVALEISSGQALRGAPLQLGYARERLQVLAVEEGDFFRQQGVSSSFTRDVQQQEGRIRAGVLGSGGGGAMGQGSVLTLRLKAVAAGEAEISLPSFEPLGAGGEALQAVPLAPLKVQVQP